MHGHSLGDAVNLFRCCVFTLNILTVVLPAFLIAGAIEVLVPSHSIMRYLGAKAHPVVSYGTSAFSGNVLSVCSCNVVPIFSGILKRGAGIGPAFCFVFAAPAIHIVNTIMTWQIIAPQFAIARFIAVPIVAILTGIIMYLLFRKEEKARQAAMQEKQGQVALIDTGEHGRARKAEIFLALLMVVLVFGAFMSMDGMIADRYSAPLTSYVQRAHAAAPLAEAEVKAQVLRVAENIGISLRIVGVLLGVALLTLLARKWFSREEATEWWKQAGMLAWKILIIFIPAVIVIAFIIQYIPLSWITPTKNQLAAHHGFAFGHPQGNGLLPTFVAALFGTLMYFPMLTEIAFVKGLLIERFAVGPTMALLLGGPGLSLPGLLLVGRVAGWKKAVAYWLVTLVLITIVAYIVGTVYGQYWCSCILQKQKMAAGH